MAELKAFKVTWQGIDAYYGAKSAGRARMICLRTLQEVWELPISKGIKQVRCVRAPERDQDAAMLKKEGHIPERTCP